MDDLVSDGLLATSKDAAETWALFSSWHSMASDTSPIQLVLLTGHPTDSNCILVSITSGYGDPWEKQVVEEHFGNTPVFYKLEKSINIFTSS